MSRKFFVIGLGIIMCLGGGIWFLTKRDSETSSSNNAVREVEGIPRLLPSKGDAPERIEEMLRSFDPDTIGAETKPLLNPKDQLERILAISDYLAREQALAELFDQWASDDPVVALEALSNVKGVGNHIIRGCVQQIFRSLSNTLEPGEVWDLAEPLDANRRLVAQETLIEYLAMTDTKKALEWFAKITSLRGQQRAAEAIVTKLGRVNLNDAVEWIDQLHYKAVQKKTIRHLNEILVNNSANIQQALADSSSPHLREALIEYEASSRAAVDFDSLLRWSESLSEGERQIAIQKGFASVVNQDLERAMHLAEENATSLPPSAWKLLSQSMTERDLSKASQWVIRQDPSLAQHTIEPLMTHWLRDEPLGASQWALDLEPGVFRDQAAYEISYFLFRKGDFEDALMWIEEIEQPELKESILRRLPRE